MKKIFFIAIIINYLIIVSEKLNAQYDYDSVTFEHPNTSIVIDTSDGNIWQIGIPQKIFFNQAFKGNKAILTDTINNFPPNDTSSFIYIIRNPYTQSCGTCMEFKHKFDIDSTNDKGMLDVSYDGGNSWILAKDTFCDFITGYGPAMFFWQWNNPFPLNGQSNGWINSQFCWNWWLPMKQDTIIVNPDSLMVRFTFISDSINNNKEGWMIDEIVTSAVWGMLCSENKDFLLSKKKYSIYPNPMVTQTNISLEQELNDATLILKNFYGQTIKYISHISGNSLTLYRENLPSGMYFLFLSEDERIIYNKKIIIIDR